MWPESQALMCAAYKAYNVPSDQIAQDSVKTLEFTKIIREMLRQPTNDQLMHLLIDMRKNGLLPRLERGS